MKKLIEKSDKLIAKIDEEEYWRNYAEKFVKYVFEKYLLENNLTKSEELLIRDLKWLFNMKLMNFGVIKMEDED